MRAIFLAVAGDALAQLAPFFRRLDANAEDLDFLRHISLGFVNKGRHLGPAPRSPTAAIKKYDGGRCLSERRGEFDGDAVDVLKFGQWKIVPDFYLGHIDP
jgi:hypothetical protein